jgi:hypothetical protein
MQGKPFRPVWQTGQAGLGNPQNTFETKIASKHLKTLSSFEQEKP